MKLFNKFNETIFLKQHNELEKQIEVLKKLDQQYPNNEKLLNKLRLCELGLKGENEIEFELKNSNIGMYVLHDLNLIVDDIKAQIDFIVITPAYTYLIECKNLIGNITVDEKGEFVREYIYSGKKCKEAMYSPLRQAERHIEIFKKIWKSRHDGFIYKILNIDIEKVYKPLVVISNSKSILNIKNAPKEIKDKIVRSDSLIDYIKNDIASYKKDLLLSKDNMYKNAYTILVNYHKDININYEEKFKELIKNFDDEPLNKEEIRNKLIEFRKNKSKEKNIPAYYIFTNNELEEILNLMPKTEEDLVNSNILSDIKVKLHGKEIVELINEVGNRTYEDK